MGGMQLGFSDYELIAKKQIKREKSVSEIEVVGLDQLNQHLAGHHYAKTS